MVRRPVAGSLFSHAIRLAFQHPLGKRLVGFTRTTLALDEGAVPRLVAVARRPHLLVLFYQTRLELGVRLPRPLAIAVSHGSPVKMRGNTWRCVATIQD